MRVRPCLAGSCKKRLPQPSSQIHSSSSSLRYCRIKNPDNKIVLNIAQIVRATQNKHIGGDWRSLVLKPDRAVILKTYTLVHPLLCKKASVTGTKTGLASVTYYGDLRSSPT